MAIAILQMILNGSGIKITTEGRSCLGAPLGPNLWSLAPYGARGKFDTSKNL